MISQQAIYDRVRLIPEGKVATYGQIAKLVGYPRHARQVGYALARLDQDSNVPWHRVINAKGMISPRGFEGSDDLQRILLEEEGVVFIEGKISLKEFQWKPKNDDIR